MKHEVTIAKTENGWSLTELTDEGVSVYSFGGILEDFEDGETYAVELFKEVLQMADSLIGPDTHRYSKERIRIILEPGDKYEPKED